MRKGEEKNKETKATFYYHTLSALCACRDGKEF